MQWRQSTFESGSGVHFESVNYGLFKHLYPAKYFIDANIVYKQVRMYYRSGTGGRYSIGVKQTLRVQSADGSTFLREMSSWPPS